MQTDFVCKRYFLFFFYKRALGAPNQEEPDGGFEEKQYYMNKIIKES